mgnify:CR=1 FL=1
MIVTAENHNYFLALLSSADDPSKTPEKKP